MAIHAKSQLDMGSQKIVSLATPTATTDATTKAYVDGLAGNSPIQSQKRVTRITADGSTTTLQVQGDVVTATAGGGGAGAIAASSTSPAAVGINAAGSSASGWATNLNYVTGRNINLWLYGFIGRLTNARHWIATLSDQSLATMSASDNPAGNYAGFRFSSGASDTKFQCICKDGTTQTIVDSGVTGDAAGHTFAINFDDANSQVLFYIDGNLVATITTHRPTTGTPLRYVQCEVSTNGTNTGNGTSLAQALIRTDF